MMDCPGDYFPFAWATLPTLQPGSDRRRRRHKLLSMRIEPELPRVRGANVVNLPNNSAGYHQGFAKQRQKLDNIGLARQNDRGGVDDPMVSHAQSPYLVLQC